MCSRLGFSDRLKEVKEYVVALNKYVAGFCSYTEAKPNEFLMKKFNISEKYAQIIVCLWEDYTIDDDAGLGRAVSNICFCEADKAIPESLLGEPIKDVSSTEEKLFWLVKKLYYFLFPLLDNEKYGIKLFPSSHNSIFSKFMGSELSNKYFDTAEDAICEVYDWAQKVKPTQKAGKI